MTCECWSAPNHAGFCPARVTRLCPKPVWVDGGWPFGQCQREHGHAGLCDVYDGRPDEVVRCVGGRR